MVRQLATQGFRIRAAVREPNLANFLLPMGDVGQIQTVAVNIADPKSIALALDGASDAINLVGILSESWSRKFKTIHVDGASAIANAAQAAGVKTLTHVSALGADPNSPSLYARTKAAGEAGVRDGLPGATIIRPSIIFGPEDSFFNRFANMARYVPALPLIGGGATRYQPVFVGDIAEAIACILAKSILGGTIYELGGPTSIPSVS